MNKRATGSEGGDKVSSLRETLSELKAELGKLERAKWYPLDRKAIHMHAGISQQMQQKRSLTGNYQDVKSQKGTQISINQSGKYPPQFSENLILESKMKISETKRDIERNMMRSDDRMMQQSNNKKIAQSSAVINKENDKNNNFTQNNNQISNYSNGMQMNTKQNNTRRISGKLELIRKRQNDGHWSSSDDSEIEEAIKEYRAFKIAKEFKDKLIYAARSKQ